MNATQDKTLSKTELDALGRAVIPLLPGEWEIASPAKSDTYVELVDRTRPAFALVIANAHRAPGKLSIAGKYATEPNAYNSYAFSAVRYSDSLPTIRVSVSKPVKQVASAIVHRLLVEAQILSDAAYKLKVEHDEYMASRGLTLARLADAAGVPVPSGKDQEVLNLPYSSNGPYGKVQVNSDTATIELRSVPAALAEQIVKLVAEYRK